MLSNRLLSTLVLISTRLIGVIISLAVLMILSRKLDMAEYGKYQQLWLLYNTVLPFFLMGLPASISYILPQLESENEQKNFFYQTLIVLFSFGFLVSIIFYFGSNNDFSIFPDKIDKNLASAFVFIPIFSIPFLAADVYFISIGKVKLGGSITLVSELLNASVLIIPVYFFNNIELSIKLYGLISLLKIIALIFLVKGKYSLRSFRFDKSLLNKQFKYSLPLALASLASMLNLQLDNWFISINFSAEIYAIYFNGARELPFISMIASSITAVVIPEFSKLYIKKDFAQILAIWLSATKKAIIIFVPLMFVFLLFSEYIITFLFSSKYSSSVMVFNVYLLLLPLRVTVYGAVLSAAGKSKSILMASLQMITINLILCFSLIKIIGIWAPLISVIISTYYMAYIQLHYTSKLMKVNITKIFPWKFMATLIIISIIPFFIILLLKMYTSSFLILLIATTGIFGVVFLSSIYFSKRFYVIRLFDEELTYFVYIFKRFKIRI